MNYPRPARRRLVPAAIALASAALSSSLSAQAAPRPAARVRPAPTPAKPRAVPPKPRPIPTPPGWVMTFDDEFNGPALDTTKWTATDWPSDINGERQDYAPDDVGVHDGALRLQSRKRARAGREYTSGEVRSVGKFSQTYGRFEFRARLADTQGTWTAEYLIAENDRWPPEIDVEEYLGRTPTTLHMTTHWADRSGHHSTYHTEQDAPNVDYTQWHVYTVEWEPGVIRWFVDGKPYGPTDPSAKPYISYVPMYIRINTALGGWGGAVDARSVWPQFHDVDYVRVYRRYDAPPPVNAGPDQELAFPQRTTHLQGISCNPMGPHTASWSQVAGPGQAAFAHPHALATSAVFPLPGTYRLRLTVSDGPVSADNDLTVRVASPQDVSVPAQSDAYTFVNSAHPEVHADGQAQDLLVGVRPSQNDTRDQMQSYLTFDLSHVPHASHATLRLYGGQIYTSYPEPLPCLAQPVPTPKWDEKSTLWTDVPALGPQTVPFAVLPFVHNSTDHWYDIDVTQAVQAAQASGQTAAGFVLRPAMPGGNTFATFHSREEAAHAPHLIITP